MITPLWTDIKLRACFLKLLSILKPLIDPRYPVFFGPVFSPFDLNAGLPRGIAGGLTEVTSLGEAGGAMLGDISIIVIATNITLK